MPRNTSFGDNEGGNFLQKFNGELSSLQWSSTFGKRRRQPNLVPTGLMLDSCGRIFLAGWGGNVNYAGPGFAGGYTAGLPVTEDAIKPFSGDSSDFYFLVLTKNAESMVYGTYLGANSRRGEHVDGGTSRFDRNGVITQAICGCRDSRGDYLRGTINAHERDIRSSNCNNGVMKLNLFDLVADMDWAGTLKCPAVLTLTNNSQNGQTYIWNMGNGDSIVSNERIIQYVYKNPGKYWLSIKAINPKTCKYISQDGDSILIPDPFPFPNKAVVDSFCLGDTLRPSFPEIADYPIWWVPQNYLSDPSSSSPVIAPLGSILYNINIRNPEGCVREIPYELRNREIRLGIGMEKEFRPCEGITKVRFFSSLDSSDFYLWDFGKGETYTGPEVTKVFPGTGNFHVQLSGGKNLCFENAFDTLRLTNQKVSIMPVFEAGFRYEDCSHPVVILRNNTLNATGYEWDFGDGIKSTELEPVHTYESPGTYRIVLRAFKDGCIESASNEIKVEDVLVPNLITFNRDGKNESLQIRGAQSDWGLDIFNRWGLPVFSTDSYQNNWVPEKLEQGIYFFTIRFPKGGFCRNWFQVTGP
jgi:PKD repeat protein